ncbi:MAG: hypothetical protein ACK55Z_27130, partial [bacterium]
DHARHPDRPVRRARARRLAGEHAGLERALRPARRGRTLRCGDLPRLEPSVRAVLDDLLRSRVDGPRPGREPLPRAGERRALGRPRGALPRPRAGRGTSGCRRAGRRLRLARRRREPATGAGRLRMPGPCG